MSISIADNQIDNSRDNRIVRQVEGLRRAASVAISSPVSLGSEIAWSSNTYFDLGPVQASATSDLPTTGLPGSQNQGWRSNNLLWCVLYAHQSLNLTADATNRWGYVSLITGSNNIGLRYAVSTQDNTLGNFGTDTQIGNIISNSYTGGTLFERVINSSRTIPANRYFLLGIVGGPFSKVFKSLAGNRTAMSGGQPVVTVLNRFYWGGWTTGPTSGIPTQLGGNTTFTEKLDYVPLLSFKFTTS